MNDAQYGPSRAATLSQKWRMLIEAIADASGTGGKHHGDKVYHASAAMLAEGEPEPSPAVAATEREEGYDLIKHLHRQRAFSARTFGPGARVAGVLDHIRRELVEIAQHPTDLDEWIDVVLLAFDGAWRSGASPERIAAALAAKQARIASSDWRLADPDRAITHIPEGRTP